MNWLGISEKEIERFCSSKKSLEGTNGVRSGVTQTAIRNANPFQLVWDLNPLLGRGQALCYVLGMELRA